MKEKNVAYASMSSKAIIGAITKAAFLGPILEQTLINGHGFRLEVIFNMEGDSPSAKINVWQIEKETNEVSDVAQAELTSQPYLNKDT